MKKIAEKLMQEDMENRNSSPNQMSTTTGEMATSRINSEDTESHISNNDPLNETVELKKSDSFKENSETDSANDEHSDTSEQSASGKTEDCPVSKKPKLDASWDVLLTMQSFVFYV